MREKGRSSGGGGSHPKMKTVNSDPFIHNSATDDEFARTSLSSAGEGSGGCDSTPMSGENSPFIMSPWHQTATSFQHTADSGAGSSSSTGLLSSLVREDGHIYSLTAAGGLLYTGSDSKNIRVWKDQQDFAGFKSGSGLVKAIVVVADRIFTGHQDGKIRVWRVSPNNATMHKRIGSLPRLKDVFRGSLKPSNYIEVRRHRNALWIRHSDAISCLSLSEDQSVLYSGSWDKTFKVWRISDSRCLESVIAHEDAVNSVVAAFDGLVFTGSADGTVKVWRRQQEGKSSKHTPVQTLLKQESAVTSLTVSPTAPIIYSGSSDGFINFWESDRQLAHGGVLRNHSMAVLCLAAAGNILLSGSADKNIYVWRREGGMHSCIKVLSGHTGPVKCLTMEPDSEGVGDGWIVYSGSLDKSVKVWRVADVSEEAMMRGPQYMAGGP